MCDIFAMTSRYPYHVDRAMEAFSILGKSNPDGWGIGYYHDGSAAIIKSKEPVYSMEKINPVLETALKKVRGKIVIGHVRYTSSGVSDDCHSHPFKLDFLGREWIFAHNGTCRDIEKYETCGERLNDVTSDSARIFEFLRDRILENLHREGHEEFSLWDGMTFAVHELLMKYDGGFNFVLTDGQLLFAFSHYRPLWILHRSKIHGDAALMTTIDEGLTDEEGWRSIGNHFRDQGILLVYSEDIPLAKKDIQQGDSKIEIAAGHA